MNARASTSTFVIGPCLLASAIASAQEFPLAQLTVVRDTTEQTGIPPGGVVWVGPSRLATLDVVRQQLLVVNVSTRETQELNLPPAGPKARGLGVVASKLLLLSPSGSIVAEAPLDSLGPASQPAWTAGATLEVRERQSRSAFGSNGGYEATRMGGSALLVLGVDPSGVSWRARVLPLRGGTVASVTAARATEGGGAIVAWEELAARGEAADVWAWVGQFSAAGDLESLVRTPLERAEQLGSPYVALSATGEAYFEAADAGVAFLMPLKPGPIARALASVPKVARRADADKGLGSDFLARLRALAIAEEDGKGRSAVTFPKRTRQEILAEAYRYSTMTWPLGEKNYAHADVPSLCDVNAGKWWKRPARLEAHSGQTIVAMPYRWGGTSTPESYVKRLAKGDLAGGVCTCREASKDYCIVPQSTGVDCSGFVSNAWGTQRYTTSSLGDASTPLKSKQDLLPGDALNNPGHHVRLFVAFEPGAEIRFVTLESSLSCGGVCEARYSAAELKAYQPLRYRAIAPDSASILTDRAQPVTGE